MTTENRKLYRSNKDRKLAGVCGGLAEYFKIDATLVRLLFVVGTILGGPGLVVYIICLIFMPLEPEQALVPSEPEAPPPAEGVTGPFLLPCKPSLAGQSISIESPRISKAQTAGQTNLMRLAATACEKLLSNAWHTHRAPSAGRKPAVSFGSRAQLDR